MITRKRGRPRRVESEVASERIWAFITPSERAALEDAVRDSGLQIGALIREAVNEYVADYSERRPFTAHKNLEVRRH